MKVSNSGTVTLEDLLRTRAAQHQSRGLLLYPPGNTSTPTSVSYAKLYASASKNAQAIRALASFGENKPVLLHVHDHFDTILWFWSIRLARGLPVLSTPFSNVDEYRKMHIQGFSSLLESPICITRAAFMPRFDAAKHSLKLHTIEALEQEDGPESDLYRHGNHTDAASSNGHSQESLQDVDGRESLAMLMLTSGSTGNAKAVCITHEMVLSSVAGKADARHLPADRPFLNWIGLDPVGALIEIHMHALWAGVDEIHVSAADIVSSPTVFLDLLSRHRVSRSFAPNFFLASLVSAVGTSTKTGEGSGGGGDEDANGTPRRWDLSNLAWLVSGGEANDMETCVKVSSLLEGFGAPRGVLSPGFGMTETCAGCIYSHDCPGYDLARGYGVASLGRCIKGMEMRVTVLENSTQQRRSAQPGETGDLELRGTMVFRAYYRNATATAEAFTPDGWFRTGDRAVLDTKGYPCLSGRSKEVVNINGVKTPISDIQLLLERAVEGKGVARLVVFPSRAAHTEQVTVAYLPLHVAPAAHPRARQRNTTYAGSDAAEIECLLVKECLLATSSRPLVFALSADSLPLLPTTTLGKISRAKMRSLFEEGAFAADVARYRSAVESSRLHQRQRNGASSKVERKHQPGVRPAISEAEASLLQDFIRARDGDPEFDIDVDMPVWELGFTSMTLIRLKHAIDKRLGISLPLVTLMKNPTARSLAAALSDMLLLNKLNQNGHDTPPNGATPQVPSQTHYNPVVTFRSTGSRTPLWLVHPGVGEVLVFAGLVQHLTDDDRPVYAFRAPGFKPGEQHFESVSQAVDTYVAALRRRQPRGPYALAGYSYGAMLALEMAKRLQDDKREEVRFLGSFNLPPHIKTRMRHLNWNLCLLNLAYFVGLISDERAARIEELGYDDEANPEHRSQALAIILGAADKARLEELGIGEAELARWADVAYGLQHMAVDYEPSGQVDSIDVFHAVLLRAVAATREAWLRDHLSRWQEFCKTGGVRFREVGGAHYTMIGPDYVAGFAMVLKQALRDRGV
ncbi:acetyl-CoA synthetase-like protein [Canariomyces notabilis]|uniref:Acetyl-CoA synthetase-like protein n=1 Tax=Canariomyces notabilis TaxID=2074819 RepID=A0AAN6TK85_9PEZI|nr:acetyl-CoA synthetase-like protein [Canariomyces arenarius]